MRRRKIKEVKSEVSWRQQYQILFSKPEIFRSYVIKKYFKLSIFSLFIYYSHVGSIPVSTHLSGIWVGYEILTSTEKETNVHLASAKEAEHMCYP